MGGGGGGAWAFFNLYEYWILPFWKGTARTFFQTFLVYEFFSSCFPCVIFFLLSPITEISNGPPVINFSGNYVTTTLTIKCGNKLWKHKNEAPWGHGPLWPLGVGSKGWGSLIDQLIIIRPDSRIANRNERINESVLRKKWRRLWNSISDNLEVPTMVAPRGIASTPKFIKFPATLPISLIYTQKHCLLLAT